MYFTLLTLHSIFRWLVLIGLIFSSLRSIQGWSSLSSFHLWDKRLIAISANIVYIQFALGLTLYFTSPIVDYFLNNFKEAIGQREIRFFGMEHITMMLIAVSIVSIGTAKSRRKEADIEKFKAIAIWFSVALLIIFLSIPWSFSPFTARPLWRWFY